MKSILLSSVAAALLIAATGAYAQQDDHQNGAHPDAGTHDTHAGGDNHMSGPADKGGAMGDHNAMSGDHNAMSADHRDTTTTKTRTTHRTRHNHNTTTTTTNTDRTTTMDRGHDDHNADNHGADDHRGDNDRGGNDNHADRGNSHHAQIDVKFRIAVTASHHFHAGEYRAPRGYTYRRYNVGERLEPAFFARDYWLADYATYDLMAPPDGYTWVRFGPDAILIDEDTGDVVQVQYGVFD